jgi:hypothetical protein
MAETSRTPEPLATGAHGDYKWLSSRHELDDLLRLCPNVLLGKYIAVTSIDSGYLHPVDIEKLAGWEGRECIGYSPMVKSVEALPHEGWDEWYVFAQPTDLGISRLNSNMFDPPVKPGEVGVFVNYGFALYPPDRASLADLFWSQIERIQPESYIADNDYLTFVTRDARLFDIVAKALNYPSG